MAVQFWFDFASTYSYPAAMRLEEEAVKRGVALAWRPFLLGPLFAAQGWTDSPFNIYPAKGAYMWRDLQRICDRLDLTLHKPTVFPQNSLLAARVATALSDGERPLFARALFHAEFGLSQLISEERTLVLALDAIGCNAAQTLAVAQTAAVKDKLRAATEEARALGVFGAPSFTVGREVFWGNDRLEEALDWATKA